MDMPVRSTAQKDEYVWRIWQWDLRRQEVEPLLMKIVDYVGNVGLDARHQRHTKGYLLYLLMDVIPRAARHADPHNFDYEAAARTISGN